MALHVLLVGRCLHSPPTREQLLKLLRRHSPRSYHATRSYLWTEDNLFTGLTPVRLADADFHGYCHYAFRADLLFGGNNDDVRVTVMLLLDLTSAVDDLVAIVTEEDEPEVRGNSGENEEVNVLLIELADVLEESEEMRNLYLTRWGVEEHDYHRTMVRRVMLAAGGVYALPLRLTVSAQEDDMALPLAFLAMDAETRERCREPAVTEALHAWANKVARVMREESRHLTVVAVPASVAGLLDVYPQLTRAALLHHTVRKPLTWLANGKQVSTVLGKTENIVSGVIQEYRMLIHHRRYVRLPLCMSRYLFAFFFHAALPPCLTKEPLTQEGLPFLLSAPENDMDVAADEGELLLGLQLTIALHRLRCEVKGSHSTIIEEFLKDVQLGGEKGTVGAAGPHDFFSQSELDRLRRKVMPVSAVRGDPIDWMRACAREAEMEYNLTEKELARLEEVMLSHSESESFSDPDEEEEEKRSDNGDGGLTRDTENVDISGQLEEMESLMETHVREALLGGGCDSENTVLDNVSDNILFLQTLQMLARDGASGK